MPLLTSPVEIVAMDSLQDYQISTPTYYTYRCQLPGAQVGGEYYFHTTETDGTGWHKRLIVKHDDAKATKRRLVSVRADFPNAEGVLRPVTVNFTATHHGDCTSLQVKTLCEEMRAIVSQSNFWENFFLGLV